MAKRETDARPTPAHETASRPWWEAPFRVLQTNLTVPDGARDGAAIAAEAQEYGANVLLLNAGGIYAFYPTQVPFHRRSPALNGDLFGDAARSCRERGLRLVARFDLSGLHDDAGAARPEWFYRTADGRPMVDKGLYITCPNGGWWQEQLFRLWEELTDRCPVDGLFFNAWGFREGDREGNVYGPCGCLNCREKFRAQYGMELPRTGSRDDPAHAAHQQFKAACLRDLSRRVYRFVKERNPDAALFAGAGARAMLEGWADVSEIELHCGQTAASALPPWRFAAGESCRWVASLGKGYASGINAVYCHVGPGRWRHTAAPPGWLQLTLAQTLAGGGNPYVMMIGTPGGQHDRASLPAVRELFHFARDHEAYYRDLAPIAPVALLWRPGGGEAHLRAFRGWYGHLVAHHRLFAVVSDAQLARDDAAETLGRYQLLIAPDAARLSDAARAAIDGFVAAGGALLAEHDAGLGLACAGVTEPAERRRAIRNAYFRLRPGEGARFPSLAGTTLIPCVGDVIVLGPEAGGERLFGLVPPTEYGAPEQSSLEAETDEPGLLLRAHGRGRVAYLPWTAGRVLHDTNPVPLDGLARDLAQELLPEPPPASVDAPPWIELTAHRQAPVGPEERLIVHLVNHSGHDAGTTRWSAPLPTANLVVTVRPGFTPRRACAARLGRELPLDPAGDGAWRVTVPEVGLFELLAFAAKGEGSS